MVENFPVLAKDISLLILEAKCIQIGWHKEIYTKTHQNKKLKTKKNTKKKVLKAYEKKGGIIYKHEMIQMTEDFS